MFWAKRRFEFAAYGPYQDRLDKLQMAFPTMASQFIMVSTKIKGYISDYYVGVPRKEFLADFDGFSDVAEQELPKEIDEVLLANSASDEFSNRFQLRQR
jgi:hypothetical protein